MKETDNSGYKPYPRNICHNPDDLQKGYQPQNTGNTTPPTPPKGGSSINPPCSSEKS